MELRTGRKLNAGSAQFEADIADPLSGQADREPLREAAL
jgi:hypothetical protein